MFQYKPKGVCSNNITFEIIDGKLHNVSFSGGCNGNLQGLGRLLEGMTPQEAVNRLKGIQCGSKNTSCPDQLSQALEKYL